MITRTTRQQVWKRCTIFILLLGGPRLSTGQFGVPKSAKTVGITGDLDLAETPPSDTLSHDEDHDTLFEVTQVGENLENDVGEGKADEQIKAPADIRAMEKLQKDWPGIPDQLLFEIGALIHSVKEKMTKDGSNSPLFIEAKDASVELAKALKVQEIGLAMEKALESLKKIERVFENPQGIGLVITDMKTKGFIKNDAHEKKFRENPDLLKTEMTKTSYLTFVALAIAGAYIEYPPV